MVLYWWCVHEDSNCVHVDSNCVHVDSNCVFTLCNISSPSPSITSQALIILFQHLLTVPSKVFQVPPVHLNAISCTFHYCDSACLWSSRVGVACFQYRRWWNGTFWAASCKVQGSHLSRVKTLFSTQKCPDWGLRSLLTVWTEGLFQGFKVPKHEANYTPPCGVKVNIECSCNTAVCVPSWHAQELIYLYLYCHTIC
jgi:hypothetical protein